MCVYTKLMFYRAVQSVSSDVFMDLDENWCGSLAFNLPSGWSSRAYITIENMSFSLDFIKIYSQSNSVSSKIYKS